MTDAGMASPASQEKEATTTAPPLPRAPVSPIVPPSSLASRALFSVVAIMALLACLTVGAVAVVTSAAFEWQTEIAQEITIQVRPTNGDETRAALAQVVALARGMPGVTGARALSDDEIRDLLEPWLGAGADLDELPVPRLVIVEIDRDAPPDLAEMRRQVQAAVPAASLDDHELWQSRLRVMANTLEVAGVGILVLVLSATVLSVVFATRGAMAANRDVVEVLHLVGAKESFIARQFERHFLRLGFKGGASGGILALAIFGIARWISGQFSATPAGDQIDALFGALMIDWSAVVGIVLTVVLIALLTAATSRLAVFHFLKVFD
jgi:cell division transport system permease protein